MTYIDFRAVAISSILCYVFEYSLLDRFNNVLKTSDTQFGFKKGLSCNHAIYSHAIYAVRRINFFFLCLSIHYVHCYLIW